MEAEQIGSDGRLDAGNRVKDLDGTLLRDFRLDARRGFESIVRRYLEQVVRMAQRFGLALDQAEDVGQEVFLRVWRGLPGFRGETNLRSWILRIAVRESSRQLARKRRVPAGLSDERDLAALDGEGPPDRAIEAEQRERLRAALLRLSGKHRQVLVLHYLEEIPCEEVAKILGCSIGTVHSRLHHARKKLKRLMKVA